jgi:hypothetical protein
MPNYAVQDRATGETVDSYTADQPDHIGRYPFEQFNHIPQPVVVEAPVRMISKLDYMNRLSDTELAAIYTAAKTVVQVEVWLKKFDAVKDEVNLDDPRTVNGVNALEAAGLLAAGRAAEILA